MSQSTLPGVNSSDTTDDESDDDQDDVECACEYGAPGCFEHYDGGSRLEEAEDE